MSRKLHPHVELWKHAYEKGYAEILADRIISQNPVPEKLVAVVLGTQMPKKHRLSRREREIVYLISVGWERDHIARALNISVETVKRHLSNAASFLGVHGQTATVAEAIRRFEII